MHNFKIPSAFCFDKGGTIAIKYCAIPEQSFALTLKHFNAPLPGAIIRQWMGLDKRVHCEKLLEECSKRGKILDLNATFDYFTHTQNQLLEDAEIIPHAEGALKAIQKARIPILGTTGFYRKSTDIVLERTGLKKYFDHTVSADESKDSSRSGIVKAVLERAKIKPSASVIFISDSKNDVMNVRTNIPNIKIIGVSRFSTHMNICSLEEEKALPEAELKIRERAAAEILKEAGADEVISDLSYLPRLFDCLQFSFVFESPLPPSM